MKRTFPYRHGKWIILGVLFGLLVMIPDKNISAQNPHGNNSVYLPLMGASNSLSASTSSDQIDANDADDHSHLHIGHIPEHGRFTANSGHEQSWPPQVKYIQNVAWNADGASSRSNRSLGEDAASQLASANPDVQRLLGERFTFIAAAPIETKWESGIDGYKVTYFSYSNNITIEATVTDNTISAVDTYIASDYQPPLRQNEVEDAIAIAREYWLAKGNSRVNELQGFTIQTFVTEGDGGYYDSRMTYVSFHVDEVSDPELLTWVDLTAGTVFRAAIDVEGVQYEQ